MIIESMYCWFQSRTVWQDVIGRHCPIFAVNREVPFEFSSFRVFFFFSFLKCWFCCFVYCVGVDSDYKARGLHGCWSVQNVRNFFRLFWIFVGCCWFLSGVGIRIRKNIDSFADRFKLEEKSFWFHGFLW